MTDLDMTWETTADGTRLIELMGKRSDILFDMDHVLYSSWPLYVLIAVALVFVAVLLIFCVLGERKWDKQDACYVRLIPSGRTIAIIVAVLAVVGVVLCLAVYSAWDLRLEKHLASIDAQIEAIRIRHPDWGLVRCASTSMPIPRPSESSSGMRPCAPRP